MDDKFLKEFKNPSAKWRGKPFWSWNGELQKDEILRQVHIIKQMGWGGHYMHSRAGLSTEYLGKEWFDINMDYLEHMKKSRRLERVTIYVKEQYNVIYSKDI